MLGAIAGDVIGSVHEGAGTKTKRFPLLGRYARFTDDTVLTVAVAECLLDGAEYVDAFHRYFMEYPRAGYGGTFHGWALRKDRAPYGSWGNGSAMRVSPVAWAFETFEDVVRAAGRSAEVTHNHLEGIRGAQATAAAIFLARTGKTKTAIRAVMEGTFGYDLSRTLDEIRPTYAFEVSCQKSVPESIVAFLESEDYEDAVRNAISLGGDADTMACIAGGIAEAFYGGVPALIEWEVQRRLDPELWAVVERFRDRYVTPRGR
jgi:ADP-ribosylglycohydrolase